MARFTTTSGKQHHLLRRLIVAPNVTGGLRKQGRTRFGLMMLISPGFSLLV